MPPRQEGGKRADQVIDWQAVDERIAGFSTDYARRPGTMPDNWMLSYRPNEATADQLGAPEWDDHVIAYADTLRRMADSVDRVQAAVPDSAANRAALYCARLALRREAEMYYDPTQRRPGAPLSATLHWFAQTERALQLARERGFSTTDQQSILLHRMNSMATEFKTMLGFVQTGGWKNESEKNRFCGMLAKTADETTRQKLFAYWKAAHGEASQFDTAWRDVTTLMRRYHALFLQETAPDKTNIIGTEGVQQYLDTIGVIDSPEELIAYCEQEARLIRAELLRLKRLYPDIGQPMMPKDDAELLATAQQIKAWYTEHLIGDGIIPQCDLAQVGLTVRLDSQVNDLSFASIDAGGQTIQLLPASAQEAWSTSWANVAGTVVHELTHAVQKRLPAVPLGWMSLEAQEGAAVAVEWLACSVLPPQPNGMFRQLQLELRRTMRVQLGLQYHAGRLPETALAGHCEQEAGAETAYQRQHMIEGIQNNLFTNGAYWFGPRFIAALAKQRHRGKLSAAVAQLARNTGLRLPGHVLMNNINPNRFHLTAHLPKVPIMVQLSRKHFPR